MRPSSLGGAAYCVALCLSVCLSVRLSVRPVSGCTLFTVAPSYERTSKIEKKLRFSLMGQRHVCTFRHAQRAAYRTAISAAQILVYYWMLHRGKASQSLSGTKISVTGDKFSSPSCSVRRCSAVFCFTAKNYCNRSILSTVNVISVSSKLPVLRKSSVAVTCIWTGTMYTYCAPSRSYFSPDRLLRLLKVSDHCLPSPTPSVARA